MNEIESRKSEVRMEEERERQDKIDKIKQEVQVIQEECNKDESSDYCDKERVDILEREIESMSNNKDDGHEWINISSDSKVRRGLGTPNNNCNKEELKDICGYTEGVWEYEYGANNNASRPIGININFTRECDKYEDIKEMILE